MLGFQKFLYISTFEHYEGEPILYTVDIQCKYTKPGHGDICTLQCDSGTLIQHFSSGDDVYVRWLVTCMTRYLIFYIKESVH